MVNIYTNYSLYLLIITVQFHCADCVARGDFAHSTSSLCETLSEKQRRLIALHRDIKETKEEISALATAKWSSGLLREDMKVTKTRIKYLKHVIKQQREKKVEPTGRILQMCPEAEFSHVPVFPMTRR